MRVLILGGGRFQGRRAAEMLVEAGHAVTVVNRSTPIPGARHVAADRDEPARFAEVLRAVLASGGGGEGGSGSGFDVVIDNIAYHPLHVRSIAALLEGRAGQYVLVSSFVVYGAPAAGGASPRSRCPISEEEADLDLAGGSEYDVGKRRCEAFLVRGENGQQCAIPWTILRFVNIDGPGDPSNRRGFFIDRVADRGGVLIPIDLVSPFQVLWCDDAARAVVLAAGNPKALGQTYNVAGEEILALPEWLDLIAETIGAPRPFALGLPMDDLRHLAGFEYRAPLPVGLLVDITRARKDLGYRSTRVDQWLPDTVAWWRGSGLESRFWEHRPKEVETIRRVRKDLGHLS